MHLFNFALPVSWWLAHGHCAHATWESIKVRLIFLLFTTQKTEEFLSPKKSSQPRWCKVIFTRNLCSHTWKMCCDSSCGRTLLTAVDSKQGPPVTRTAQSRVACFFFFIVEYMFRLWNDNITHTCGADAWSGTLALFKRDTICFKYQLVIHLTSIF